LGHVLSLNTTNPELGAVVQERFNEEVLSFAWIRSVVVVSVIERTALGKLKRG
jgi:hypothetical protein